MLLLPSSAFSLPLEVMEFVDLPVGAKLEMECLAELHFLLEKNVSFSDY